MVKKHVELLVALAKDKNNWGKYTRKDLALTLSKDCGYYVSEEHVRMVLRSRGLLNFTKKPDGTIQAVPSSLKGDIEMKKPTNDQVREVIQAERIAKQAKEKGTFAERKYKVLLDQHERVTKELDSVLLVSQGDIRKFNIQPRLESKKGEAVPFIVLSDFHAEERVDPRTIGGKNRFNLKIAEARSKRVAQSALKLMQEKNAYVDIDTVAVFLLGDFISGNIHEETVENALLEPITACLFAQGLLESMIDFWLEQTPWDFNFYCKVGNHSRITRRVHISTEFGNSLELAMYVSMMRRYEENPRVKFHIEPSYYSVVNILGTRVRFHHGHAINYGGGVGGLTVPLRKAIKNWNETERADVDILGHFHSMLENSTHKFIVNGSLIGYNAYAERIKAVYEEPIQTFGIIHKKYGVTAIAPIFAQ